MKKILCALFLDFCIIVLNIVELIYSGFFRDIYSTVKIAKIFIPFFWISFFLSIGIFFTLLCIATQIKQQRIRYGVKVIMVLFIFSIVIINAVVGIKYYSIVRNYPLDEQKKEDYISSEYFRGITLDELRKDIDSDDEIMIYIGREDCKECQKFEKKFEKILKQVYTEMPTYYTSKDREGDRREEMYNLLEKYRINSVPCVIVVKESKIVKIWKNPENELCEIKKYL